MISCRKMFLLKLFARITRYLYPNVIFRKRLVKSHIWIKRKRKKKCEFYNNCDIHETPSLIVTVNYCKIFAIKKSEPNPLRTPLFFPIF